MAQQIKILEREVAREMELLTAKHEPNQPQQSTLDADNEDRK